MMTREQYLFGKLAEECGELAQEAIKCQQFGTAHVFGNAKGVTNIERLNSEFNDVLGVISMINDWICGSDDDAIYPDQEKIEAKKTKVQMWYEVAQEMGFTE